MPKKLKGGPFGIFQHPFCRKTPKKLKGGPFGKKFFFEKKSHRAENTLVPLVPLSFLDDVKILLRKLLKYFI